MVPPVATVTKTPVSQVQPSLADIQAKLKASNDEKVPEQVVAPPVDVLTTLQQEEEVSISGSNARLMIMQKLSRKTEVSLII